MCGGFSSYGRVPQWYWNPTTEGFLEGGGFACYVLNQPWSQYHLLLILLAGRNVGRKNETMKFFARRTFPLALICSLVAGGQLSAEGLWKAGVAKMIITPAQSMWLAGYATREQPSDGK